MHSLNPIQERRQQILKGIVDTFHDSHVMIIETPENPIIGHREFVSDNIVKGMGGGDDKMKNAGKAIANTSTGKQIFDNLPAKDHKGFTPEDHRDAADIFHSMALSQGVLTKRIKARRDEHHTLAMKGGDDLKDRAKKKDGDKKPEKKDKVEKGFEDDLNGDMNGSYEADDRDLLRKGEVLDKLGMGYGGNNAFTFTKTGKELKEILPSTVATLNAKKAALEATMETLKTAAGCDPTEIYASYSIKSIACKRYPYDSIRTYDSMSNKYSDMTDEQKAMQGYNDLCYAWQSISEDIVTCKVISKNLDDSKKYTLTVSQLIALASGDDDLMKAVEDNLEKGGVGSGRRKLGTTQSGKQVFAHKSSKWNRGDPQFNDWSAQDHKDAEKMHKELYKKTQSDHAQTGELMHKYMAEVVKDKKEGGWDKDIVKSIHINPKNEGKFDETKKETGKTAEELAHSKNPVTKKRAVFAENAKHWDHSKKSEDDESEDEVEKAFSNILD